MRNMLEKKCFRVGGKINVNLFGKNISQGGKNSSFKKLPLSSTSGDRSFLATGVLSPIIGHSLRYL
jgi:hypothetical protein